jgi:hypothetical protein
MLGLCVVAEAANLPPDYKSAVDDLHSIPGTADFGVIEEVSNDTDEANTLIVNLRSLTEDQRANELEKVRAERQKLVRRTAELRATLEGIRQLRGALELAGPGPSLKELSLRKEGAESSLKVFKYEKEKADGDLKVALDKDKPGIENYINEKEGSIKSGEADIEQLERKIAALSSLGGDEYQKHVKSVDILVREGQLVATSADYALNNIDDLAGEMLRTNIFLNSYTNWSTLVFSALVALVIGSFFLITYKTGIGGQILAGDSGIQFVTLFALIIAIILFGVLKILEGKELAALLGGLSGYILGRGSLGQRVGSLNVSGRADRASGPSTGTPPTDQATTPGAEEGAGPADDRNSTSDH